MTNFVVQRIAIGGDHAGFPMKSMLVEYLREHGLTIVDCGTCDEQPADFPDFAEKVAGELLAGSVERGILVCFSGEGVSVEAITILGVFADL